MVTTLKSIYLEGTSGLTAQLNNAFDLGRRFIQPVVFEQQLADAVDVATTTPMFTIKNSGDNSVLSIGSVIKYISSGNEVELVVAGPLVVGSTFNTTVAPASALTNKSLVYSGLRPTSYNTLVAALQSNAASGVTKFSVSIVTSDNPSYLRLKGTYMNAYFAGILYALGQEKIFSTYEVALSLDTTDTSSTKVTFNFTF